MSERLYIYVKDWERHQPRSDKPGLPWIRLETRLLGDDVWFELEPADVKLLITIWLLSQRYGNGRVVANQKWLCAQANLGWSPRSRNLERLIEAGWLTVSSTQAPHRVPPKGVLEEKRGEEPFRGSSPIDAGSKGEPATPNGAVSPPTGEDWTEEAETAYRKKLAEAALEAIKAGRE